jgi:two-component system, NtrC family, sensor histidine kinase KinB
MKQSIRTRFTLGMIFIFLIILVLSVFSGYIMNKLSNKTSAILKENYLSVVYAREMSEVIMNINQEIIASFLSNKNSDSLKIENELTIVNKSLQLEKNNITEPGEGELVSGIDADFKEYRNIVLKFMNYTQSSGNLLNLQNKSGELYNQLSLLSQMNGKAIEVKTDDAKKSSKSALTQMTVLATLCFLIALSFIYSFSSYFNERFFQLYNGIKEIVSSNYNQRLYFNGKDEFYDLSLVFNEMAEKLNNNKKEMSVTLQKDSGKDLSSKDVEELKKMVFQMKIMQEQASALLSRFEKQ